MVLVCVTVADDVCERDCVAEGDDTWLRLCVKLPDWVTLPVDDELIVPVWLGEVVMVGVGDWDDVTIWLFDIDWLGVGTPLDDSDCEGVAETVPENVAVTVGLDVEPCELVVNCDGEPDCDGVDLPDAV